MEDIALSVSRAISNPCRASNSHAVNFLIHALTLYRDERNGEVGWIHCESFLVFLGVQSAINRYNDQLKTDCIGSAMCLRQSLLLALDNVIVTDTTDHRLAEVHNFIDICHDIATGVVWVRRKQPVTDEEYQLLETHQRVYGDNYVSYSNSDCYDSDAEFTDNKTEMKMIQVVYVRASLTQTSDDLKVMDVPVLSFDDVLSAMKGICNLFTPPALTLTFSACIYSKKAKDISRYEKKSGPRVFVPSIVSSNINTSAGVDASKPILNRIASWLLSSHIYGDAVISTAALGICAHFGIDDYREIRQYSLPSGLWIKDNLRKIYSFPSAFQLDTWPSSIKPDGNTFLAPVASKSVTTLVEEYITRRAFIQNRQFIKKIRNRELYDKGDARVVRYIDSMKKYFNDRNLQHEESLPYHYIWSMHVKVPTTVASPDTNNVSACLDEITRVCMHVPISLFYPKSRHRLSVHADIYTELGNNQQNSINGKYAESLCGFQVLKLLQQFGEEQLNIYDGRYGATQVATIIDDTKDLSMFLGVVAADKYPQYDFVQFQCFNDIYESYLDCHMLHPSIESEVKKQCAIYSEDDDGGDDGDAVLASRINAPLSSAIKIKKLLLSKNTATATAAATGPKSQISVFNPPLAVQRIRLVSTFLNAVNAKTWLDVGCGDGLLINTCIVRKKDNYLLVPKLTHVFGVDINRNRMVRARKVFNDEVEAAAVAATTGTGSGSGTGTDRGTISDIKISYYHGSIITASYEPLLLPCKQQWDVITCIEVIEHLPCIDDATASVVRILTELSPKYAIFSTPNYDANSAINGAIYGAVNRIKRDGHDNNTTATVAATATSAALPFREADHKFEFTHQQCVDWSKLVLEIANAALVITAYSYTCEFTSLGNRIGMEAIAHGATQVMIFTLADTGSKGDTATATAATAGTGTGTTTIGTATGTTTPSATSMEEVWRYGYEDA